MANRVTPFKLTEADGTYHLHVQPTLNISLYQWRDSNVKITNNPYDRNMTVGIWDPQAKPHAHLGTWNSHLCLAHCNIRSMPTPNKTFSNYNAIWIDEIPCNFDKTNNPLRLCTSDRGRIFCEYPARSQIRVIASDVRRVGSERGRHMVMQTI
jgi:hypothetical protein